MIGLMVVMLMSYSLVVSMVLVLLGVSPVLRSKYGTGKRDVSRMSLQEFNISYILLKDSHAYWPNAMVQVHFLGGQNVHRPIIFDIVNFCYKLMQ